MSKLTRVVLLLGALIFEVAVIETFEFDNATDATLSDETRLLLGSILASKCRATLNRASMVLPTATVFLTRLANNRLYYFSPALPVAMHVTFDQAVTFCQDHGMHLVTINSERENLLVYNRAVTLSLAGPTANPGAWIGLRDTLANGMYKWVQPGASSTVSFFNAAPTRGNCAAYNNLTPLPPAVRSWVTTSLCTAVQPFICEMEAPCNLVL